MTTIVIFAALAAAVGGVVGWLLAAGRKDAQWRARLSGVEVQLQAERQAAVAERDLARRERERAETSLTSMQQRLDESLQLRVAAETKLDAAERMVAENRTFVESSRKELENTFAALANHALKSAGEQLLQMGKTQIDGSLETKKVEIDALLRPVREMVDNYRAELMKSEQVRTEIYGGMQEQIRALLTAQEASHREASRLANALASPVVRGSWGEATLRRCVELAGMSEFSDFTVQETFENEEGRKLRPDLIVRLPNERVIAVDSKVPLSEYKLASDETDDLRRREYMALHARTVRRHIDTLSRREYQGSIGESLDFVVLFVPGDHFLSAALVSDPTLFDHAAERKICLASPITLLPLLHAINAGWKAEKTEENAKKMHDVGVELFNRFVKVMEHISAVGEQLHKTVERYNGAIGSIDRMLWPKATELQRMSGSGKGLEELQQLDVVPLESTKLRLTIQPTEPAEIVQMPLMKAPDSDSPRETISRGDRGDG